jgi:protein arginine kinase activator
MFICEICKKNQATVHVTDIHENEKKELHLCQECAEAKGISFQTNFSLPDLLAGLSKKKKDRPNRDLACPECGLTYNEFQARGRFGCSHDYQAFREELMPMIERIHGRTRHRGKRAALQPALPQPHREEIDELQQQMREAVDREAYEEAAQLRDAISRLKRGDADDEG